MTIAKVGKRGCLVIPAKERKEAEIQGGDYVEVLVKGPGLLIIRKVPSLREVQRKMASRLPQWSELEGVADELLEKELQEGA